MSTGDSPTKGSDIYAKVILSTDVKPIGAFLGQLIIEQDTGLVFEWGGAGWCPRIGGIEIDPLVKSMPTTSTFHHLGHEGKVFIHSHRAAAIAAGAEYFIIVRMPAGLDSRQAHLRYAFNSLANTGTLDVDVELYKEPTVTDDGDEGFVANTNDRLGLSSGVLIFTDASISVDGEFKVITSMTGTNKSTSSRDTNVPEWILTPDGANARDYTFKITNNGLGTADVTSALFFYDTGAA